MYINKWIFYKRSKVISKIMLDMSKCVVTGGAGFIGSHLTDKLIEEDHEVIVIDNLLLGKKEFVNRDASFYKVDIRDFESIRRLFEGVDVVFHLAADPRLPFSIEDPIETHCVNVTGTLNVFESARKAGVRKVVFTSSAAVYGDEVLPIVEDIILKPKSPYGLHKYIGEQYARLYYELFGLYTVCLRYFNVYGPRKLANGGYPMAIPIFLEQRRKGEHMTITSDGEQTRDYVHVSDVVRANILAWQSDVKNGQAYNIAGGVQTSVNQIADFIGGDRVYIPERKGEVRYMQANTSRAKIELDWSAKISLEKGIYELKKEWGV